MNHSRFGAVCTFLLKLKSDVHTSAGDTADHDRLWAGGRGTEAPGGRTGHRGPRREEADSVQLAL